MVSSVKMILALTVLATAACTGYAIKCYQCDSLTYSACGKDFQPDSKLVLDCTKMAPPRFLQSFFPVRNATGCMKQTIDIPGNPQIVRSCYFGNIADTKLGCQTDPSLPINRLLSCDVCTEDECNGSSSLAPIAGVILLFFGLARLLA
ncbi:uncharacterized protein LOC6548741 [Drosophila erecta]|uniref:Uncharacterized protein n=1 Tax=Drosophila erecta TaxID=7220 RepID=B3NKX5_DROER|nr:uncharacterized protein LOC6548741 [Drosophila erecta]XP_026836757.1 uncharacterized protein LOC6548741 [Drosophila erecta]XP_026836758.1 uncharacterized protein LOC6548741 [Drosophila erecta]EDV54498.1 uncharacterized protein Dere_GG21264 [Drosophila erecta]